jgi:hypothetical protein
MIYLLCVAPLRLGAATVRCGTTRGIEPGEPWPACPACAARMVPVFARDLSAEERRR